MRLLIPTGEERSYDNKRVSILLNNGVPMGLQFSITGIGIIMLQSANNALGTVCVASFTAAMRIKYLFTCVFENIGVAMATYCGQNIGARKLDRIRRGVKDAIGIMLVYFVLTVLIIYPFADDMMMLFVKSGEQEVIDNAAMLMRIANYFYPGSWSADHLPLQYPRLGLFQSLDDVGRDGDDRTLRSESVARAGFSLQGRMLWRSGGLDFRRSLSHPCLSVALSSSEEGGNSGIKSPLYMPLSAQSPRSSCR